MKQKLYITALFIITNLSLLGCSQNRLVHESQTSDIHVKTVSDNDEEKGYLQRKLDNWLKNDWEPTFKNTPKSQKLQNDSQSFKLQNYVDKAALYMKKHPNDTNDSLIEEMETLPAIGKRKGRF